MSEWATLYKSTQGLRINFCSGSFVIPVTPQHHKGFGKEALIRYYLRRIIPYWVPGRCF